MSRLIRGLIAAIATTLLFASGAALAADGDATAGKQVFKRCKACHSIKKDQKRVGPSVFGVIGRKCGTAAKTRFSRGYRQACKKLQFTWDAASLDAYLKDPSKYISKLNGKKSRSPMSLRLSKAKDRANVIAYLMTLK